MHPEASWFQLELHSFVHMLKLISLYNQLVALYYNYSSKMLLFDCNNEKMYVLLC